MFIYNVFFIIYLKKICLYLFILVHFFFILILFLLFIFTFVNFSTTSLFFCLYVFILVQHFFFHFNLISITSVNFSTDTLAVPGPQFDPPWFNRILNSPVSSFRWADGNHPEGGPADDSSPAVWDHRREHGPQGAEDYSRRVCEVRHSGCIRNRPFNFIRSSLPLIY